MRTNLRRLGQRSIAALTGVLVVGALTAACGSDSDDDSASSSGKLTKVSIGIASPTFQDADVMLAKELGYFEKYGLDVTIEVLNGSSAIGAAMKSGSIQFAEGDGTASASAMLSGIDAVFFGGTLKVFPMEMWARKGINSVADLKGKKLGAATPGSLTQIATDAVLATEGMTEDDVNLVHLSNPSAKFAALKSGAVDAALANPPGGNPSAEFGATVIFDASSIPNLSNGYVAMRDYAAENPDVLVAFLKATREGIVALGEDPDRAKELVGKYSKETNPEYAQIAYDYFLPLFTLDPSIDESLLKSSFDNAQAATGKKAKELSSYYDDTAVQKLMDEGFLDDLEKSSK